MKYIGVYINMTSLVVGGLFNAIAFSGAGFLFSKLNRSGYEEEMKRHNKALEVLAKAKEKWYENEVAKKDRIQELRQQLSDANHDINDTNRTLDELRKVRTVRYERNFSKEPELGYYYKPSKEMQKYQTVVIGGVGLGSGWLIHKVL